MPKPLRAPICVHETQWRTNVLQSKVEADLHFERIAAELEAIADVMQTLQAEDRGLAVRLKAFAHRIRIDSGLEAAADARREVG